MRIPKEAVDHANAVVESNPRGAPITLPKPPCALDDAPVNSRVVVLQWPGGKPFVEFVTPNGHQKITDDDYAHSLPLGADVMRAGTNTFVAIQRDAAEDHPPLICTTAEECIARFKFHFHGARE